MCACVLVSLELIGPYHTHHLLHQSQSSTDTVSISNWAPGDAKACCKHARTYAHACTHTLYTIAAFQKGIKIHWTVIPQQFYNGISTQLVTSDKSIFDHFTEPLGCLLNKSSTIFMPPFTIQATLIQAHLPGLPSVNSFQNLILYHPVCFSLRLLLVSMHAWCTPAYELSRIAVSPHLGSTAIPLGMYPSMSFTTMPKKLPARGQIRRGGGEKYCSTFYLCFSIIYFWKIYKMHVLPSLLKHFHIDLFSTHSHMRATPDQPPSFPVGSWAVPLDDLHMYLMKEK